MFSNMVALPARACNFNVIIMEVEIMDLDNQFSPDMFKDIGFSSNLISIVCSVNKPKGKRIL